MKNNTNHYNSEKFIKELKFFKTIISILLIVSILGFAFFALSPLSSYFFGDSVSKSIEALGFGFTVKIGSGFIEKFPSSYFTATYLTACSYILTSIFITATLRSILNDILKNGSPFIESVSKKIKLISIFILISMLLKWFGEGIAYFILTNKEFLDSGSTGIKFTSKSSLDLSPAFISGILYLLSFIFDYGLYLKEDNESIV